MNIYAVEGHGRYCGGVVIAAAESKEQAVELACTVTNAVFEVDFSKPVNIEILTTDYSGKNGTGVLYSYFMGE